VDAHSFAYELSNRCNTAAEFAEGIVGRVKEDEASVWDLTYFQVASEPRAVTFPEAVFAFGNARLG
jgi:hypothetical protein